MSESNQIYALIPRIMAEVGAVEKTRRNQQQGYQFRGVDDVMGAFHAPLAKHGVFFVPDVLETEQTERQTKAGGLLIYTRLKVAYTFYAPDGSCVRAVVVGEAMDSGDKSSNKAMSAALKYALLQIFCVPVEEQDDADNFSPQPQPQPKRTLQAVTKEMDKAGLNDSVRLAELHKEINTLCNLLTDAGDVDSKGKKLVWDAANRDKYIKVQFKDDSRTLENLSFDETQILVEYLTGRYNKAAAKMKEVSA